VLPRLLKTGHYCAESGRKGLAGILELVGGVMFLIGIFTRSVAFVLCGFIAAAYFMGHATQGNVLIPMLNQGELAVLYCFVFLYFAVAGAGTWSVDASWRRPRP